MKYCDSKGTRTQNLCIFQFALLVGDGGHGQRRGPGEFRPLGTVRHGGQKGEAGPVIAGGLELAQFQLEGSVDYLRMCQLNSIRRLLSKFFSDF